MSAGLLFLLIGAAAIGSVGLLWEAVDSDDDGAARDEPSDPVVDPDMSSDIPDPVEEDENPATASIQPTAETLANGAQVAGDGDQALYPFGHANSYGGAGDDILYGNAQNDSWV